MSTMRRITVTVTPEMDALIRAAAGDNLSQWLARAAGRELAHASLISLGAAGLLELDEDLAATLEADLDADLENGERGDRAA